MRKAASTAGRVRAGRLRIVHQVRSPITSIATPAAIRADHAGSIGPGPDAATLAIVATTNSIRSRHDSFQSTVVTFCSTTGSVGSSRPASTSPRSARAGWRVLTSSTARSWRATGNGASPRAGALTSRAP